MKNINIKLSILLFVIALSFNQADLRSQEIRLMIANTNLAGDILNLNPYKFEQALNFISIINPKFELIPTKVRDSIANLQANDSNGRNIYEISKNVNADYIVFSRINAFKHLIRTDVNFVNSKNGNEILRGYGYSRASLINEDTGELIYDPAILESLQRAMAAAFKDSTMFVDTTLKMNIKPIPLLIIGGLFFVDDNVLQKWDLFDKKVVNSYDAIETIFETNKNSIDYLVIDTETRDSIYYINKMFVPENYTAPSQHELLALYKMDISYYLSGTFTRLPIGARLELTLYKFNNGVLELQNKESEIIAEDSLIKFKETIKFLSNKLLSKNVVTN